MTTTQEVIDGYLERMESPSLTRDAFDDLAERIQVLKALGHEN